MPAVMRHCRLLIIFCFWLGSKGLALGQVGIAAANTAVVETFDGMGPSGTAYLPGWTAVRYAGSGTLGQTLDMAVTNGSQNSGNIYNVGTPSADDRAWGSLASGSTVPRFGTGFQNNTGLMITSVDFAGVMEQWRSGNNAVLERNIFEYSLEAAGINDAQATWLALPAMDLVEKVTAATSAGALDGNLDTHRTALASTIAGLAVRPGATIWIRWSDSDATGSDGLLAIDDFSVRLNGTADLTAPGLAVNPFTPPDDALEVATTTTSLSVIFNENVQAASGDIILRNLTDGTSQPLAVTNTSQVRISGDTLTLTVSLAAAKNYAVQIPASALIDITGNAFGGFSDTTTWNFSTVATATPVLQVVPDTLAFGAVAQQTSSASLSFVLAAANPLGEVALTVTAPFLISRNNTTFSQSLAFSAAELSGPQTVFVRFGPAAAEHASGVVAVSSPGAAPLQVWLRGEGYDPFSQDFAGCINDISGGWTAYSVTGDQVWTCTGFGRTNNGVQANGYAGSNNVNEDWLISPALDLTAFDFPLLHYWSRSRFAGDPLRLMVSVNYSGSGDPYGAGVSWTEVDGQFAPVDSDVWQQASGIDLSAFKQPKVFVAFVYNSTATSGSRWTLDDFWLADSPHGPFVTSLHPLTDLDFGTVIAPEESANRTFTFSVAGLNQNLTLSAPAGFVVSKYGFTYASSLVYTPAEAGTTNTVYLKFKPTSAGKMVYTGTIRFSSGSELSTTAGFLSGNTVPQALTFDVVNWNIEWFGAANGPADNSRQAENVVKVLTHLDADMYVLQEISNQQAFADLVRQLPGYKGFTSPYISSGSSATAQRLAFIYKTATVDSVAGRGLLTGAGQPDNFWASGRLPYMFTFDARVNGVSKRIHLVNVHPKANDNNSPGDALEAYNRRKFDVQVLKDTLDQHYGNANIMLAGDYNDDIDFTVAAITATNESTFKDFVTDTARYQALTMPLSQAGLRTYITFDNVIDHMVISNELVANYLDHSARIVIPFDLVADYGNTTSDHLPVSTRFVLAPSGPGETGLTADFQVFPNPARTWLQVFVARAGAGPAVIALYDLTGRQVYRREVATKEEALDHLVPLGGLPRNIYVLVVNTSQGLLRHRLILR